MTCSTQVVRGAHERACHQSADRDRQRSLYGRKSEALTQSIDRHPRNLARTCRAVCMARKWGARKIKRPIGGCLKGERCTRCALRTLRLSEPGYALKIRVMRYACILALICLCSSPLAAQSPSVTLAPTGTLRAAFLAGNPVQGRIDAQTGEASGPAPDLVKELARKLGVPYAIIPAQDARAVIDALKNKTADIGFLAYDETRAREVDFGAAFVVMFNSYLVRANSPFQQSADVDRAGSEGRGSQGADAAAVRQQPLEECSSARVCPPCRRSPSWRLS